VTATPPFSSPFVGGLAGANMEGVIVNSSATGSVSGSDPSFAIGGLAGYNNWVVVAGLATGSVSGSQYVGGLVGYNDSGGSITNGSASGAVSDGASSSDIGGLV